MARAEYEKQLLQTKLQVQEHTFNYISEEIHDNVGQWLCVAAVELGKVEMKFGTDDEQIVKLRKTLQKVSGELREMAKGLNSSRLQSLPFTDVVEQLADRISQSTQIHVVFKVTGQECQLEERVKLTLFRVKIFPS